MFLISPKLTDQVSDDDGAKMLVSGEMKTVDCEDDTRLCQQRELRELQLHYYITLHYIEII